MIDLKIMVSIALTVGRKYSWGTTVAQIAVMRKMILISHSLYKNNVKFNKGVYEKSIGI